METRISTGPKVLLVVTKAALTAVWSEISAVRARTETPGY